MHNKNQILNRYSISQIWIRIYNECDFRFSENVYSINKSETQLFRCSETCLNPFSLLKRHFDLPSECKNLSSVL